MYLDETMECCYRADNSYDPPPLIYGLAGWNKGSGFIRVNGTDDQRMREVCCDESKRLYHCESYSRVRPLTSDRDYLEPKQGVAN